MKFSFAIMLAIALGSVVKLQAARNPQLYLDEDPAEHTFEAHIEWFPDASADCLEHCHLACNELAEKPLHAGCIYGCLFHCDEAEGNFNRKKVMY